MRCELAEDKGSGRGLEELQAALRQASPAVPQFLVRTRLGHFADRQEEFTYAVSYMRHHRTVAFCGLGNPDNFFDMLELEGIRPLARKVFRDHHRYSIEDVKLIEKLAQENRADCLLTTEKDLVNLPSNADFSVPLDWAVTDLVVQEEERLLEWIRKRLDLSADGLASVDSRRNARYQREATSQ
jgi:tetraacyldisaccharide 4'-kinase